MSEASKNNGSLAQPQYSDEELLKCLRCLYDNADAFRGRLFCPGRIACRVENSTFLDRRLVDGSRGPLSDGCDATSAYYSQLESSTSSICIHYFERGNPDEVDVKRIIENDNADIKKYSFDFITISVKKFVEVLNEDGRHDLYSACEKLLARKAAKEAEKKEKLLSESTTSTSSNALENIADLRI